ncbi:MAG: MFS transporter [Bacteroidota bacterium]|nr:MFS transporter [Bacteroidota bacterium]
MTQPATPEKPTFSRYQIFIIAVLAILQFTIILDFMVLSPLGAILLKELDIQPQQFGWVVSAYAFSAGASGLLAAGFADRFDRKKLLLFFYVGFLVGTSMCAIAHNYHELLIARIVTGIFGGVIGSVTFAIVTDLFRLEMRGRVMGFVQMAFAASQVLGLPIGLWLANHYGWHSPFVMIVSFSIVVGIIILIYLKPVTGHLKIKSERNPLQHLATVVSRPDYLQGFLATVLLATGGFMMMPFATAFSTNNAGISINDLPLMYTITGGCAIFFGPLIGKISDTVGKFKVFVAGSIVSMITVVYYSNLSISPFWLVTTVSVIMFAAISSRIISASALLTAVPSQQDRGAFMSVNSSVQQISGGIASAIAGLIVIQQPNGLLMHYDTVGYVVAGTGVVAIFLMHLLDRQIHRKLHKKIDVPL